MGGTYCYQRWVAPIVIVIVTKDGWHLLLLWHLFCWHLLFRCGGGVLCRAPPWSGSGEIALVGQARNLKLTTWPVATP
jgi:hypothetical protein